MSVCIPLYLSVKYFMYDFRKADLFLKPILRQKFNVNSIPITQFRGHRFNIMPVNAKYVYCLQPHLVEFLSLNNNYGLTASLLFDLQQPFNMAVLKTFSIMELLFTSPLWRMIEDKEVDVVEMNEVG